VKELNQLVIRREYEDLDGQKVKRRKSGERIKN